MSSSQIIEHVAGERLTIIEADGLPAVFSIADGDGQKTVIKSKAGTEQVIFSGPSAAEAAKTLDGIAAFHGTSSIAQRSPNGQATVATDRSSASRFSLRTSTVLPWAAVVLLAGGVLAVDDDEIQPEVGNQPRQLLLHRRAPGLAHHIAEEEKSHAMIPKSCMTFRQRSCVTKKGI